MELLPMPEAMHLIKTNTDVLLLEPLVFRDARGFFLETYNQKIFAEATGVKTPFIQDNHAHSKKHVLRGLHYQLPKEQGKLIRIVQGMVFDVAVDMRRSSPTFGHWTGVHLVAEKQQLLWVPPGFAHGYVVLSDSADLIYKTTGYYNPSSQHCLKWNDHNVGIKWPIDFQPILSFKDQHGTPFNDLPYFE